MPPEAADALKKAQAANAADTAAIKTNAAAVPVAK
jgi:hypothetical protein